MARPASPLIPAARVLHEELLNIDEHPPPDDEPTADFELSPCDYCVDLTERIVQQYGAAFHDDHRRRAAERLMDREQIEEGLSRAVIGGLVSEWLGIDRNDGERIYHVDVNDNRVHVFSEIEAAAFAVAVFAAERAAGRALARVMDEQDREAGEGS